MVKLLGGTSDLSSAINDMNTNLLELQGRERVQIFKDDQGVRRVLLGKGADGFYGLKVSQTGNDVYSAADDDLIFNSDQNMFKIVKTGTLTVPQVNPMLAGERYTASEAHGLSYVPAFMGFVTPIALVTTWEGAASTSKFSLPYFPPFFGTNGFSIYARLRTDTTSVYADVFNNNSTNITGLSGDWIFKYYLFQETAV
jgi:hypothetical protein